MKLFHMYHTSITKLVVGRDININGNKYRIDTCSEEYMKYDPTVVNYLELYKDYKFTAYHPDNPNPEPIYLN